MSGPDIKNASNEATKNVKRHFSRDIQIGEFVYSLKFGVCCFTGATHTKKFTRDPIRGFCDVEPLFPMAGETGRHPISRQEMRQISSKAEINEALPEFGKSKEPWPKEFLAAETKEILGRLREILTGGDVMKIADLAARLVQHPLSNAQQSATALQRAIHLMAGEGATYAHRFARGQNHILLNDYYHNAKKLLQAAGEARIGDMNAYMFINFAEGEPIMIKAAEAQARKIVASAPQAASPSQPGAPVKFWGQYPGYPRARS